MLGVIISTASGPSSGHLLQKVPKKHFSTYFIGPGNKDFLTNPPTGPISSISRDVCSFVCVSPPACFLKHGPSLHFYMDQVRFLMLISGLE